ncbi:MAG: tyrosine-type recombinase/integrase [Phycisphaeraceae bacterium]
MASLIQRKNTWYLQWSVNGTVRRRSLRTSSKQLAKEKLRAFESARFKGEPSTLPTRTPIPELLDRYVRYIRTVKTAKSAQTDVYYLREMFGPCCDGLKCTSRRRSPKARKRPILPDQETAQPDGRVRPAVIEAQGFELITSAQVSEFISGQVRRRGLAPKTANRYREIAVRLFNWAMREGGVTMPGGANPAASVERYRERAPQIRFLNLEQVEQQLHVLRFKPRLQTMVAVLIYAGLRREELLWLTQDDLDLRRRNGGHGMLRIQAKTIGGQSWQPKTRVNRAVPISSDLRVYLDRYRIPKSDHGWLFPSPKGCWWDPDNFSADLRAANKEANFVWSCLDYRHTFGSQLAQRGVSLYKVSTLMGNSPEICRRHYAALIPEGMAADVEFGLHTPSVQRATSSA